MKIHTLLCAVTFAHAVIAMDKDATNSLSIVRGSKRNAEGHMEYYLVEHNSKTGTYSGGIHSHRTTVTFTPEEAEKCYQQHLLDEAAKAAAAQKK